MSQRLDLDRIRWLVDALDSAAETDMLEALKGAVIGYGGRWDLPSERVGDYQPCIMSVQVFGVYAMAEVLEELPDNWIRAARNVLTADNPDFSDAGGA
ncbi:MAG TPA: hypothetical protein DIT67_01550 [Octadecabacter sp.]|nr:hypothetical protein [Octadecabacter sp.]